MKKYKVLASYLIFTVKENGEKEEYVLKKGDTVDLPENNMAVRALLVRKQIVEVAPNPLKGEEIQQTEGKNSKK